MNQELRRTFENSLLCRRFFGFFSTGNRAQKIRLSAKQGEDLAQAIEAKRVVNDSALSLHLHESLIVGYTPPSYILAPFPIII